MRVSALSMVYDLLMRFGLQAFINKDDEDNAASDIKALLDVELSARKRHNVSDRFFLLNGTILYAKN